MEIIVKYVDSIRYAEALFPGIRVAELFNQYAIVTISEEDLDSFSALPEIVYVELPKRVYYNLQEGRSVSCLAGVQKNPAAVRQPEGGSGRNLTGKGVYVGIVDSGERVIILSSLTLFDIRFYHKGIFVIFNQAVISHFSQFL